MPKARVIIVGGGFGGLAAARALRNAPADIHLIDRTNHHLFQPLLYQVATSVLTPGQIASPIRAILHNQQNTTVILGEVTGIDKEQKCVIVRDADREGVCLAYDYLILATGVSHSYFGRIVLVDMAPRVPFETIGSAFQMPLFRACSLHGALEIPLDPLLVFLAALGPD